MSPLFGRYSSALDYTRRTVVQGLIRDLLADYKSIIAAERLGEHWAFTRVYVQSAYDENGKPTEGNQHLITDAQLKRVLMLEAKGWIDWVLSNLLHAGEMGEVDLMLPQSMKGLCPEDIAMLMARTEYPEAFTDFVLYRFWADNQLLYIGRSVRAFERLKQHQHGSDFFHLADCVTLERFGSAELLDQAERDAIRSEAPKYNKVRYWSGKNSRQTRKAQAEA